MNKYINDSIDAEISLQNNITITFERGAQITPSLSSGVPMTNAQYFRYVASQASFQA